MGRQENRQRRPFGVMLKVQKNLQLQWHRILAAIQSAKKRTIQGEADVGLDQTDLASPLKARNRRRCQCSKNRWPGGQKTEKSLWLCSPRSVPGVALSSRLACWSTNPPLRDTATTDHVTGLLPQPPRCRLQAQTGWAVTGPLLPESCGPISVPCPSAGGESAPVSGPEPRLHSDKQMGLKAGPACSLERKILK